MRYGDSTPDGDTVQEDKVVGIRDTISGCEIVKMSREFKTGYDYGGEF